MLIIDKGNQNQIIYLTLSEMVEGYNPDYTFKFRHVATNEEFVFGLANSSDLSTHKERINKFAIDATVEFANAPLGQYIYTVIEYNTDNVLENGKAILKGTEQAVFTSVDTETNFIIYEN
jgi:hypothetical protein